MTFIPKVGGLLDLEMSEDAYLLDLVCMQHACTPTLGTGNVPVQQMSFTMCCFGSDVSCTLVCARISQQRGRGRLRTTWLEPPRRAARPTLAARSERARETAPKFRGSTQSVTHDGLGLAATIIVKEGGSRRPGISAVSWEGNHRSPGCSPSKAAKKTGAATRPPM